VPTLSYPSPKQAASILGSTARINIWDGSVRASKTVATLIRWLDFVAHGPDGELLLLAKTERTLARNILHPLEQILAPGDLRIRWGAGEATLWGRRMYLGGANDESAVDKIKGVTLAGLLGDEISTWPPNVFKMVLSRLSIEDAKLFGTTNPEAPMHWLMAEYLSRADELDLARFHFTIDDNPFLAPAFVAALKKEYTGLWYRRYIEGEWVVAEGAIYDMLDDRRHLVDVLPELIETWDVIDYGTTNPTVFLALSLGVDGRLYVHDEWRWDSAKKGHSLTDAEYSGHLRAWHARLKREPRWIYVDPSAASFSTQLWRDKVRGVVPADNTVIDGIREVAMLLGLNLLKFHAPTTVDAWGEFVGYVWDPKKQAKGEDAPLKVNDHAPDAVRYGIRSTHTVWHPWISSHEETAHVAT
jgi:PBSX family phage terminase large subunit